MSEDFIGSGWSFPLRIEATGRIALVSKEREIEEAIRLILGTSYGERPMRPEFGCGIHEFVFSPADATTAGHLAFEVQRSLERWEPRIDVLGIEVMPDAGDGSTLYIDITYAIRGSNDPRNLVFPFYVIPAEGEASPVDHPPNTAPGE
ncbi:MAG: GPW/gp25 family protein [Actinobacteria bacterium]|nr:MAG: GPW/gp25 family protein [Actinomycetota bacterium]